MSSLKFVFLPVVLILMFGFQAVYVHSNPVSLQLRISPEMVDLMNSKNITSVKLGRSDIIPPLPRTYRINDTTLNIDAESVRGSLALSNVVATGLDKLVDDISVNLVTLKVTMSFLAPTTVYVSGDYVLDGTVTASDDETISVNGNGPFSGSITNMNIAADGKLLVNLLSGKVGVTNVELQLSYDSIQTNAENFEVNGDPVDWESFNTDLNENFDSIWNTVNEPIVSAFTEAINDALGAYTWSEIVDLISGSGAAKPADTSAASAAPPPAKAPAVVAPVTVPTLIPEADTEAESEEDTKKVLKVK